MQTLLLFLAVLAQAGSVTMDKVGLGGRGTTVCRYIGTSYLLHFIFMLCTVIIFQLNLSEALSSIQPLLLVALSTVVWLLTNMIFYHALAHDRLAELQTFDLLRYPLVIVMASIYFSDERNFTHLILALIAAVAVAWSRWDGKHFHVSSHTLLFFAASVILSPISVYLTKLVLQRWHPALFQLVRSGVGAVVATPLLLHTRRKEAFSFVAPSYFLIMSTLLSTAALIIFYASYQRSGVVFTTLVELLQPSLVYLAAVAFFRERPTWKQSTAFVVVLACVGAASVLA